MTIASGSRLGAFEIQGPLGAGGMGEVWRARDSRLGRDVAIKALPEAFASDPERLARFEREARLLASLSHPNIAGIHGLEEVDGRRYLVLEYIDGETLAERLARGALPLDEALDVCRRIAAAVEAAHEAGVIHRDLKPANVKLTAAGEVKVLDFGLAKGTPAGDPSSAPSLLSQSPTVALSMTGAGVILGTAAYMSPEQARGKAVDRRTDIWSFGCVLYECLAGRQLFEGETVSDLIARILEREPDWSALPASTPSKVRDLLRRCLDKDAKRRMRDIGDARIELEEAIAARAAATRSDPALAGVAPAARRKGVNATWTIVAAVAGALAAVLATRLVSPWLSQPPAAPPVRFSIDEPAGMTLAGDAMEFAISPDGRTLAFVASDSTGTGAIWLRPLDSRDASRLAGTDNPSLPFWSPDGKWLAFFADGKLKKIPATGGNVEVLADANNGRGGAWNRDGTIVFGPAGAGPLFKIAREGEAAVPATTLDSTRHQNNHRYPCFLPDGKHFLYAALPPVQGRFEVFVGSLDGGAPRLIGAFDSCPIYVHRGLLLFMRGSTVVAQRFDARRLRLLGDPVSLGETPGATQYSGAPSFSVSPSGVMVTVSGTIPNAHIVRVAPSGALGAPLPIPSGRYRQMDLSPDGRRLVVERIDDRATQDLWIVDRDRATLSRFTHGDGRKANPVWAPDGRHIAYACDKDGPWNIYLKAAGGAGEETPLFESPTPFKYPNRWSWDGKTLVAETLEEKTGWDLWTIAVDDPKPLSYLSTPFNERFGAISPDGRWMAYTSDESGKNEIYVQSYPDPVEKHQISTSGGQYNLWREDSRVLLFFSGDFTTILAVDVGAGPGFSVGRPRRLFPVPPRTQGGNISADLSEFLVSIPEESTARPTLDVMLHWEALLAHKK